MGGGCRTFIPPPWTSPLGHVPWVPLLTLANSIPNINPAMLVLGSDLGNWPGLKDYKCRPWSWPWPCYQGLGHNFKAKANARPNPMPLFYHHTDQC